jgi:hypothetical protein
VVPTTWSIRSDAIELPRAPARSATARFISDVIDVIRIRTGGPALTVCPSIRPSGSVFFLPASQDHDMSAGKSKEIRRRT